MARAGRGLRGAAARLTPPPGRPAGRGGPCPRGGGRRPRLRRRRRRGAAVRRACWLKRPGDPPVVLQEASAALPGCSLRSPRPLSCDRPRRLPPAARPGQTPDGRRRWGSSAVHRQRPFAPCLSRPHGAEPALGESPGFRAAGVAVSGVLHSRRLFASPRRARQSRVFSLDPSAFCPDTRCLSPNHPGNQNRAFPNRGFCLEFPCLL